MKRCGLDSIRSWMVVGVCCLINILTFGSARMSTLLLSASITYFGSTNLDTFSLYTLCMFMRCIVGPLAGFLGHQFGAKFITIFGSILGAVGVLSCSFAHSMDAINVLWGVVYGLGISFSSTILPAFINQNFDEHKAKASCVSNSGFVLGYLILTPVVEFLLKAYGLPGTFLLLSGILLNCIPLAVLLTKPSYKTEHIHVQDSEIIPEMRVTFSSGDNNSRISDCSSGADDDIAVGSLRIPKIEIEGISRSNSGSSYQEKINRLSTQTLLSNYLVRMSCSGALDLDEILENSKSIKNVNPGLLEAELFSSYQNADFQNNSLAVDLAEKRKRFASVHCERPLFTRPSIDVRKYSLKSSTSDSERKNFGKFLNPFDKKYYYQSSSGTIHRDASMSSSESIRLDFFRNNDEKSTDSGELYDLHSNSKDSSNIKITSGQNKKNSVSLSHRSISTYSVNKENYKVRHKVCCLSPSEKDFENKRHFMNFLLHPIFILTTISNVVLILIYIWITSVASDLCRNIRICILQEKHIHLVLSVSELIGYLCNGFIIDGGHMTMPKFTALCFIIEGSVIFLLVWIRSFIMLLVLLLLLGFVEAGLIMILPVMIGDYLEDNKQVIAIPSSLFLTAPFLLILSTSIGHIHDNPAAQAYFHYGIGTLCAVCSVLWLLVSRLSNVQRQN